MDFKRLPVVLASLLAVGCGSAPVVNAPLSTSQANAVRSLSDGNGQQRTFSFDYARAAQQQAKRPVTHFVSRAALPASIDLRKTCSPVGDQGQLGSCTAWSMTRGLREFMINKNHETFTQLSPLYFYYQERVIEGSINDDAGATITDGMTVLANTGVCPEKDWPYITSKFAVKPAAIADKDAPQFKVHHSIPIKGANNTDTLNQIKTQVAAGNAVAFGFQVFSSFMGQQIASTGMMPMPKPNETVEGGHAVLIVGYDDAKKVLIVRNSWGTTWGDKGYFYMPYDNMQYCDDFWTAD